MDRGRFRSDHRDTQVENIEDKVSAVFGVHTVESLIYCTCTKTLLRLRYCTNLEIPMEYSSAIQRTVYRASLKKEVVDTSFRFHITSFMLGKPRRQTLYAIFAKVSAKHKMWNLRGRQNKQCWIKYWKPPPPPPNPPKIKKSFSGGGVSGRVGTSQVLVLANPLFMIATRSISGSVTLYWCALRCTLYSVYITGPW